MQNHSFPLHHKTLLILHSAEASFFHPPPHSLLGGTKYSEKKKKRGFRDRQTWGQNFLTNYTALLSIKAGPNKIVGLSKGNNKPTFITKDQICDFVPAQTLCPCPRIL